VLADRLFGDRKRTVDYKLIPTTVFTPLEYSSVGLTEEEALQRHGEGAIDVYHMKYV
jgi:pyruvate/2-oxoglutarate dehydrogenase complex dihydrolipoamide dehydrogenase (E3) component